MAGDGARDQLRLRAAYLKSLGLDYVMDPPIPSEAPATDPKPDDAPPAGADPETALREVRAILGECTRCKLHAERTQIVFGAGPASADLMFVGEGPGAEEDRQGIPFVGKAGQLLTRIITQGMGLGREDVYIANIVKCRPPQNRDPQPDEVEQCFPFLRAQIRAIRPKIIVALGRPASQTLLDTKTPISKLRGKWGLFEDIPLMPTFHPSYLLRNPPAKKEVWEDIQQVMAKLGLPAGKR